MSDRLDDFNGRVIAEFRANGGVVGGPFAAMPLLLLTTVGARTQRVRVNPLTYLPVDDHYAVFASVMGAPSHPAWFHNLVANPHVIVEVGVETFPARARVTVGDERDQLWQRQIQVAPQMAEHATRTTRQIPVVVLERLSTSSQREHADPAR